MALAWFTCFQAPETERAVLFSKFRPILTLSMLLKLQGSARKGQELEGSGNLTL